MRSHTADAVAPRLLEYICRYGIPTRLLSDQGAEFESNLLQRLYQNMALRKIRTAPYHPRSDGCTERFNRTLIQMLRCFADGETDWDCLLPPLLFAYRSAVHNTTGFSPYQMLYGRMPILPGHLVIGELVFTRHSAAEHISGLRRILRNVWDEAAQSMSEAQHRQKMYFSSRVTVPSCRTTLA
jgi:transposase InsO family protein